MGGTEDHRRRRFALAEFGGNLQAIQARHTDIQQHHIGLQAIDQAQCLFAVAGRGFKHTVALEFAHHSAQALTGQGFVIDNQDIHNALASCRGLAQG